MEADTRTAELYTKHVNTDIIELVIIDETTHCEKSKDHNAKGKYFCKCGSILPGFEADQNSQ